MMRCLLFALTLLTWGSCNTHRLVEISGRYVEAPEMNQITLRVEGEGAMTFSIEEAEMFCFEDLVEGAPVQITYAASGRKGSVRQALRVEVDSRYLALCGRWIELGSSPEEEALGMGVELCQGGSAHSIGMQTLLFKEWEFDPQGRLRLKGHCLTGGETTPFDEWWTIDEITSAHLLLSQEDITLRFRRQTDEETESLQQADNRHDP